MSKKVEKKDDESLEKVTGGFTSGDGQDIAEWYYWPFGNNDCYFHILSVVGNKVYGHYIYRYSRDGSINYDANYSRTISQLVDWSAAYYIPSWVTDYENTH